MNASRSAPSIGSLTEQPLSWSQGTVHCESPHDSATVTRWAGRLRSPAGTPKRRHHATQLPSEAPAAPPEPARASSHPVRGIGKVSPPSLLEGVSSVARTLNKSAHDREMQLRAKSKGTVVQKERRNTLDNANDEKMIAKQVMRMTSSLTQIKTQHEKFKPMDAQEKSRAALFRGKSIKGDAGNIALLNLKQEENDETWEDKIEAWKFARRIEPELPPLEHKPSEFEPLVFDQTVVKFNARADVLQRNSPEAQLDWLAYRGASREAHQCVVTELRARRKADFLSKRKADAFKSFKLEEDEEDFEVEDEDLPGRWLIALVHSSWAAGLHEELKMRKLSAEERDQYVEKHGERLAKSKVKSGFVKQTLVISSAMKDPQTKARMDMLACMFSSMMKTKMARRRANNIHTCLGAWKSCGTLILFIKKIGARVKMLQQWWRKTCMPRLSQQRTKLYQRWLRMEREETLAAIKAQDKKEGREKNTPENRAYHDYPGNKYFIPMETRIGMRLLQEKHRWTFITHELRVRRYMLLPSIALWEADCRNWEKELLDFQETRKALAIMGAEAGPEAPFRWPPQRPTCMPTEFGSGREVGEREVKGMISRARAIPPSADHPLGGGWTQIPKKVAGESLSYTLGVLQATSKGKEILPGGDADNPFGILSHEEIQEYQIVDHALPTAFRETAPRVKVPEWRQIP